MRAVIFVNGVVNDYGALEKRLQPDDYLICADGGSRHCAALDLRPHVVVGDLDSAEQALLDAWRAAGTAIEGHPPAKDQTDLELALERAVADGADEILLLGALGGRLDQTLANLLIPAQRPWPVSIRVADGGQVAELMRGGDTVTLDGAVGSTVSIIPLSARVTGITYRGMRYPLEKATLALGSTRGISNEIAEPDAAISIDEGILLVVRGED